MSVQSLLNALNLTAADACYRIGNDYDTVRSWISGKRKPSKSMLLYLILRHRASAEQILDAEALYKLHVEGNGILPHAVAAAKPAGRPKKKPEPTWGRMGGDPQHYYFNDRGETYEPAYLLENMWEPDAIRYRETLTPDPVYCVFNLKTNQQKMFATVEERDAFLLAHNPQ